MKEPWIRVAKKAELGKRETLILRLEAVFVFRRKGCDVVSFYKAVDLLTDGLVKKGYAEYRIVDVNIHVFLQTRCLATLLECGHGTGNPRLLIGVPVGRGDARQA